MKFVRVIPLTMLAAAGFLVLKISDLEHSSAMFSQAQAEQSGESAPAASPPVPAKPAASTPSTDEAAAKAEAPAATPSTAEAKPAVSSTPTAAAGDQAKPAEATDAKKEAPKEAPKEAEAKAAGKDDKTKNPAVSDTAPTTDDNHFTAIQLDLLQNLAKRREELDRWEQNIQIKEEALNATEKRIDDKIAQIESMRQEVTALLAQYNDKEDAKIQSLVKIYENMKPQDAARIFNDMDPPVVLLVIDHMPEKKSASILAAMDAHKAKQITVELAEKRKFDTAKLNPQALPAMPPAAPTSQQ